MATSPVAEDTASATETKAPAKFNLKENSRTYYIPPTRKAEFDRCLTKIQRRRPGTATGKIIVDLVIEEGNRLKDIPGLDIPEIDASQNGHES